MNRFGLTALAGLLLCVGLSASSAPPVQDDKPTFLSADTPAVLKGLKEIGVVIEPFPKDFLLPALTMDSVRTDVELKLRQNGFHVLPPEQAQKGHIPTLNINLSGFKSLNDLFVYSITLSLQEDVKPVRMKNVVVVAATVWQRGFVGATGELNLPAVRADIKEDIDTFLTDYQPAPQKP